MFDLTQIKKKNICIVGLMGSGKSTIGKGLSKYLNFKFIDTDQEIEIKTKKSIVKIFEENGELYFREIEEKICTDLLTRNNCVISLGGGSIINKKIRNAIKKNSYSIYLQVDLKVLLNRIKLSKRRPLLNKIPNKRDVLENLYNYRRKFYENADFIVKNNFDKFEVLKKIQSELNSYAQ